MAVYLHSRLQHVFREARVLKWGLWKKENSSRCPDLRVAPFSSSPGTELTLGWQWPSAPMACNRGLYSPVHQPGAAGTTWDLAAQIFTSHPARMNCNQILTRYVHDPEVTGKQKGN